MVQSIDELLKGLGIAETLDSGLNHINEDEETKKRLAKRIDDDIRQYVSEDDWEDEPVCVKIKDGLAYVVWKDCWIPTVEFYRLVLENGGKVGKTAFVKRAGA